jgi:hypothetical protein
VWGLCAAASFSAPNRIRIAHTIILALLGYLRFSSNRTLPLRAFSLHAEASPPEEKNVSRIGSLYSLHVRTLSNHSKKEILAQVFDVGDDDDWSPRYNVAPSLKCARRLPGRDSSRSFFFFDALAANPFSGRMTPRLATK